MKIYLSWTKYNFLNVWFEHFRSGKLYFGWAPQIGRVWWKILPNLSGHIFLAWTKNKCSLDGCLLNNCNVEKALLTLVYFNFLEAILLWVSWSGSKQQVKMVKKSGIIMSENFCTCSSLELIITAKQAKLVIATFAHWGVCPQPQTCLCISAKWNISKSKHKELLWWAKCLDNWAKVFSRWESFSFTVGTKKSVLFLRTHIVFSNGCSSWTGSYHWTWHSLLYIFPLTANTAISEL